MGPHQGDSEGGGTHPQGQRQVCKLKEDGIRATCTDRAVIPAGDITRVDHTGKGTTLIMNLDLPKCICKSNYFLKYYGAHLVVCD